MSDTRRGWKWGLLAGLLLPGAAAMAAFVVLPDGSRREGTDVRSRSDGTIILTTPQGQFTYQRGQYQRAEADKPTDYDNAARLAQQKRFDDALKLLAPIIQNYRFLEWDNKARILQAQIHLAKGDAAAAAESYEQLFRATPEYRKESDVLWGYYGAMVAAKQFDKLAPQLDELINKGSRNDAARAQVLRGDIKMGQANVEGAVLDYLRSALLFESEKSVQPEALYKAAEALEKLRDPRAKDLYRKVAAQYGGTPWGQRAAGK